MSFMKGRMKHAAVNTDPLRLSIIDDRKQTHYGLKKRNVPHIKINDMKEIGVWYEFGDKIGEGGFGVVITVTQKSNNKVWAMKSVSKSTAGDRMKLVEQEIQVLKLIHHPHIIHLDKVFESSKNMYLIFEKCHGDFGKMYDKRKPFVEKVAQKIISELVDAVAYLHKYDIVHRDLKLENMLLGDNPSDPDDEYYIKLSDFGLSIIKSGKGVESMLHDYCGTVYYMAPEMITTRSYSQMCDMWSVGVILYMLVMGKFPFLPQNEKDLQEVICTENPDFKDIQISKELKNLILMLLVKDPVNRLRATEMLQHPWMLNKKLSKATEYNIFEKMKEWKAEMKVQTGAASDWVATPQELADMATSTSKQVMNLPKTNVLFDRAKRASHISRQKVAAATTELAQPQSRPSMVPGARPSMVPAPRPSMVPGSRPSMVPGSRPNNMVRGSKPNNMLLGSRPNNMVHRSRPSLVHGKPGG